MKRDQHKGSGILFFFPTAGILSFVLSVALSFASFLYMLPYLNLASAILFAPLLCALLQKLLFKMTEMASGAKRVTVAIISLLSAYGFVCMMMGVVSGVFGAEPLDLEDMRYFELEEYIEVIGTIIGNAIGYLTKPIVLWQDIIGRGEPLWAVCAFCAFFTQAGLPQLFIDKRCMTASETGKSALKGKERNESQG